jgi:hypothetical protein
MTPRARVVDRATLAGETLGLGTIRWGGRHGAAPRIRLTDRDLRLMALLYEVNFLSSSQLVLLGWDPVHLRAAQQRLKRLHDGGLLDRCRPASAAGNAEWNYLLSTQGWRELITHQIADDRHPPSALGSVSDIHHDLELAALILRIAIDAGAQSSEGLIESLPFTWQGPRSGRIESDRVPFECSTAARLRPDMPLHPEASCRGCLEPDATLIGAADGKRWGVLVEYERPERARKQTDRLRRYDRWLLDGWRRTHFATQSTPPGVVFITAYERSLRCLIETADEVLSAWYGHQHAGPREGIHAAREQILFSSRERILAGEWTMEQTPSLPPALRGHARVCRPRSLVYDLPAAFAGSPPHAPGEHEPADLRSASSDVAGAMLALQEAVPSQHADTLP